MIYYLYKTYFLFAFNTGWIFTSIRIELPVFANRLFYFFGKIPISKNLFLALEGSCFIVVEIFTPLSGISLRSINGTVAGQFEFSTGFIILNIEFRISLRTYVLDVDAFTRT